MRRLLALLFVVALAFAGCGGDDEAPTAAISGDDPAGVLPADLPLVVSISSDLGSEQWQAALEYAGRLDPSDQDLEAMLRAELDGDEVSYTQDVEPWIGERAAVGLNGFGDDVTGVFAVQTTDVEAARATLEQANGASDLTYKGVRYGVDEDDDAAQGIIGDFVVAASDEAQFKAAIDASEGESIAEVAEYADTMAKAPEDSLAQAYFNVDGFLAVLEESGTVPPGTIETIRQTPGFEPGQAAVAAVVAEGDKMTLELAAEPTDEELPEGPSITDLPAEAWLAAAGAIPGEGFTEGFEQGIEESGVPGAAETLDRLGLRPFLEGLEGASVRLGGATIAEINGELSVTGSDEAAASDLVDAIVAEVRKLGAPIQEEGDGATLSVPPYEIRLTADGATVKLSVGDPPEGTLGDDDAFSAAADALGFEDVVAFVDFALLQEFVGSLPDDSDTEQALAVLPMLGYLAIGSEIDGDTARSRVVLTLR